MSSLKYISHFLIVLICLLMTFFLLKLKAFYCYEISFIQMKSNETSFIEMNKIMYKYMYNYKLNIEIHVSGRRLRIRSLTSMTWSHPPQNVPNVKVVNFWTESLQQWHLFVPRCLPQMFTSSASDRNPYINDIYS